MEKKTQGEAMFDSGASAIAHIAQQLNYDHRKVILASIEMMREGAAEHSGEHKSIAVLYDGAKRKNQEIANIATSTAINATTESAKETIKRCFSVFGCKEGRCIKLPDDAVVADNMRELAERSIVGVQKYGVTLENANLTEKQIVKHALEETLDLANYLRTLLKKLK